MTNKLQLTIVFSAVLLAGIFFTNYEAKAFTLANCESTPPSVPTSMTAGQQYEVTVTCQNQAGETWSQASGHKIVSISNTDNTPNPTPSSNIWGVTEVRILSGNLDNTNNIQVGHTKVFRFNVTPATAGTLLFRWQVYESGGPSYNGYTPPIYVTVTAPVPAPTCSSAGPDNETVYTNAGTRRTFVYSVANASSVYLPAWSDYGGQDDIVWYGASIYSGSTWYYDIPLAQRNGTGNISVYGYMYNSQHSGIWCDSANFNLQPPPPVVDMYANGSNGPLTIPYNTNVTLSWSASNSPTSCTASSSPSSSWSGSQSTGGGWNSPNLTSNHTFTLTCSNGGGSHSDSVTVNVGAPPSASVDIYANGSNGPLSVAYGTQVTLSWSSSNASSCTASSTPSSSWSGSQSLSGGWNSPPLTTTTTFTLTCSGNGASGSDSVTVNVSPPAAATVNIYANGSNGPLSVAYGTQVTLSWSSSNASSCTASSTPSSSWSGSQSLSGGWNSPALLTTHTFTITCSGSGPTGSDSVVVNVQPPPPVPTCTNATPDNDWTTATSGIRATYANGVGNATTVYFATWSEPGEQDDIAWYTGSNQGGGTWRADINLASHSGLGTINVHVYMYTVFHGNTWCDSANFSRIGGNGRIEVNSNVDTSWTITCNLTNPSCPTYSGTNTKTGSYDNVPYGTWTISPLNIPGYDVQVQPSATRTIP